MFLILLALLVLAAPAWAAQPLTEYETAPFGLAVHPWMPVEVLDHTSQPGYRLALVMPPDTVALTVLSMRWPRSDTQCYLGISQQGQMTGGYPTNMDTCSLAVIIGEGEPKKIDLPTGASGVINRLCVWPTARSADAELIFLYTMTSLTGAGQDTVVYGFRLDSLGEVQPVDTGSALTLYGWFEARDINDDGTYELVTSRNLDGTWGGFFYHAVRNYDAATGKYIADPDSCQDYFQRELAWLNWVVETRELIAKNPEPYFNTTGAGYIYVAEYNGVRYGFDSVIEVPPTFGGVDDVQQYNRERQEAFRLVQKYRDELSLWLEGGSYPATWKMTP